MADIQFSDNAGNSIDGVPDQVNSLSSLAKYLVTEPLHLLVLPDLAKISKDKLSDAAKDRPLHFDLDLQHGFDLGAKTPVVQFTPESKVVLAIDTTPGDDLFSSEPFEIACTIPEQTGYVSLALAGSVHLDGQAPVGQFTPSFKAGSGVTFKYCRAFGLGTQEPAVGAALSETAHGFVIPASVPDLHSLQPNDVAAVSGDGSLTLAGDFSVSFPANPLAAVDLPLNAGSIAIKDGAVVELSVSFEVEGSYQLRVRKLDDTSVELLYAPERSTTLQLNTSALAGVSVQVAGTELLSTLLDAVDGASLPGGAVLEKAGLSEKEAEAFGSAVKAGIDRSVAASVNQAFSSLRSQESAFVYHIDLDRLDADSTAAVEAALHGNLSLINRLEAHRQAGGVLAPGLRVVKSMLGRIHDSSCTVNLNLLGIVNFSSLAEFISRSEILTDSVTGDITLKQTLTGNRISSIDEPFKRDEALRKALFDSVVATLVHSASGVANLTFSISGVHFALHRDSNPQNLRDYLGWFFAFGLLQANDSEPGLHNSGDFGDLRSKDLSTCLIRVKFDPAHASNIFLDHNGAALSEAAFLDAGRRALLALLDPVNKTPDRYRKLVLEDTALLGKIIDAGSASNAQVLLTAPANAEPIFSDIYFDAQVIAWWSSSMGEVARSLEKFKTAGSNFDELGKKLVGMIKRSPARFDQPWGLLALSLLAASERYGRIVAAAQVFERSAPVPLRATAA